MTLKEHKQKVDTDGFSVIEGIYSTQEVAAIQHAIAQAERSNQNFRGGAGLFAIRQFLNEIPGVVPFIFNNKFKELMRNIGGPGYFVTKSIYFDKPGESNWFVAWHRDTTISADKRKDIEGYGPWTVKHNQYAVQPPRDILAASFTLRIHLDDTNKNNGALKVIPSSHLHNMERTACSEQETICDVAAGGVMIMKPLLLHASGRTTNNQQRRVIHIEFCNQPLATPLQWAEYMSLE